MSNASEIKKNIIEIGKAKITFKTNSKDFLFNGKAPRAIPKDYYTKLHLKFGDKLFIQLKDNCTAELLNNYINCTKSQRQNLKVISENHRVHYVLSKSKHELADDAESTHEDIMSILATQNSVLLKIQSKLEEELEFVGYKTSADYQLQSAKQNSELELTTIPFSDSGKATFKMSKKEALMFLYVLEQENLLEFEDEMQRRKFIENNFNYTEMRENKSNFDEACEMKGISKEFSNFGVYTEREKNNTLLNKLKHRLNETIQEYQFKTKKS